MGGGQMRVAVFGLGYVGTVTAAGSASRGHEVCGVDIDAVKVGHIRSGRSPVVEPGIGQLLAGEDLVRQAFAGVPLPTGWTIGTAMCPGFLREGSGVAEFAPPFDVAGWRPRCSRFSASPSPRASWSCFRPSRRHRRYSYWHMPRRSVRPAPCAPTSV